MKPLITLAFVALLAACGADGVPVAPASQTATQPGLSVSGCVNAGIVVGGKPATGEVNC